MSDGTRLERLAAAIAGGVCAGESEADGRFGDRHGDFAAFVVKRARALDEALGEAEDDERATREETIELRAALRRAMNAVNVGGEAIREVEIVLGVRPGETMTGAARRVVRERDEAAAGRVYRSIDEIAADAARFANAATDLSPALTDVYSARNAASHGYKDVPPSEWGLLVWAFAAGANSVFAGSREPDDEPVADPRERAEKTAAILRDQGIHAKAVEIPHSLWARWWVEVGPDEARKYYAVHASNDHESMHKEKARESMSPRQIADDIRREHAANVRAWFDDLAAEEGAEKGR